MKKKINLVVILIFAFLNIIPCTIVNASTYYDEESESNDTVTSADIIISERLMRGKISSSSDVDYYKIYAQSGEEIYIQLSRLYEDFDLKLYYQSNLSTPVATSTSSDEKSEYIKYTVQNSGYYYIKIYGYLGAQSSYYYSLYSQVFDDSTHVAFNQSFYITNVTDAYMYRLGRDSANNIGGLIVLDFGEPAKNGSEYGITDHYYAEHYINLDRVKELVDKFIEGYNDHYKHTENIKLIVGINNCSSPSYPISDSYFDEHGAAFANMLETISTSGKVTGIYGGMDAEHDYNEPEPTIEWVEAYDNNCDLRFYNYGDHTAGTWDFSGETNPSFNNGWTAEDVYTISWGLPPTYPLPEIYNSTGHPSSWTYQKKWRYMSFQGVMSTNGWGLSENQDSYDDFMNKLTSEGVGQSLANKTWICLPAQDYMVVN